MTPKIRINPDELLEFFSQLDPGGSGEEKCELHYGCGCVVKRGVDAARVLVAVRELLGYSALDAAAVEGGGAGGDGEMKEVKADLKEAKTEIDRLLLQNMQYHKENKSLKERVQMLQRQVERLYTKKEMAVTLKKIEEKKLTDAEMALEKADDGGGEPPPENGPAPKEDKRNLNKELADELNIEAAVPVPKEQLEKEREEREKASETD